MKISVITAVYNGIETIEKSMNSILSQQYQDKELIVVDGASTDGTYELLQSYGSRIDVLLSERDRGIYDALNKGILLARGDIIGFMHADDFYPHDKVLNRIADAFSDNSIDAVYGDMDCVSKNDVEHVVRYWKSCEFKPGLIKWGWMPPHPTFYARRAVYEEFGMFNTAFHISADYDFLLRVLVQDSLRFHYIPEVLVKMRLGGKSNSGVSNILRKLREDYSAIKRNGIGGLGSLIVKNLSKIPQFVSSGNPRD